MTAKGGAMLLRSSYSHLYLRPHVMARTKALHRCLLHTTVRGSSAFPVGTTTTARRYSREPHQQPSPLAPRLPPRHPHPSHKPPSHHRPISPQQQTPRNPRQRPSRRQPSSHARRSAAPPVPPRSRLPERLDSMASHPLPRPNLHMRQSTKHSRLLPFRRHLPGARSQRSTRRSGTCTARPVT